ncbi:hypothetical protein BOTBODRAFT_219100 [Botryobasidium botryosum FD-172 SS1]|uniref:Uncharacterized protein n=1 Tax=Botryobasidium botryosum (strain FD-172 SS1) TaxID=930990 RepID=A0A067MYF2_BOTB1|nr:hypothetical protein BOTBODRAFT_219100 [Botryobasidium botryosum FD-172 SS1]
MAPSASSSRAFSPTHNGTYSSNYTLSASAHGASSRPIASKLVIQGTANQNGARLKLFLKIGIPEMPPGHIYQLLPEGHNRLISHAIHPLCASQNSAPYAFPPSTSPMLHNACRALELPDATAELYTDVLTGGVTTSQRLEITPAMVGEIVISDYWISYVSPRVLPPSRNEDASRASRTRATSIGERAMMHFVVALELSTPLVSKPPMGPYMINLKIPKCLSNRAKIRVFQSSGEPRPPSQSRSLMSLSSASTVDEPWELRTHPLVTARPRPRSSSSASAESWADDEEDDEGASSGASGRVAGTPDILHGTFPSSDVFVLRWAPALRTGDRVRGRHGEIKKKVSVEQAQSTLRCVLGKGKGRDEEGMMRLTLDFEARCTGLYHPGVETMVGLDFVLDSFGGIVQWLDVDDVPMHGGANGKQRASKGEPTWLVQGGNGYKGWSWQEMPTSSHLVLPSPSAEALPPQGRARSHSLARTLSDVSTISSAALSTASASLLRTPLPGFQAVADYSFEGPSLSEPDSLNNMADDDAGSDVFSQPMSRASSAPLFSNPPPTNPATIHVDLIPLLPESPDAPLPGFAFKLRASLLIGADCEYIPVPSVRLPNVHSHSCHVVLVAEDEDVVISAPERGERTTVVVDREGVSWDVEVARSVWDGGAARAGGMDSLNSDGLLIVREGGAGQLGEQDQDIGEETFINEQLGGEDSSVEEAPLRRTADDSPTSPTMDHMLAPSLGAALGHTVYSSTGGLTIPWVSSIITLIPPAKNVANSHWRQLVRAKVSWPYPSPSVMQYVDTAMGFGFLNPGGSRVKVLEVTIGGRHVPWEAYYSAKDEEKGPTGWVPPVSTIVTDGKAAAAVWACWVKVAPPSLEDVGVMEVRYVVDSDRGDANVVGLDAALPAFNLPVASVEVVIGGPAGFVLQARSSELCPAEKLKKTHHRFVGLSLPAQSDAKLKLTITPSAAFLIRLTWLMATIAWVLIALSLLVNSDPGRSAWARWSEWGRVVERSDSAISCPVVECPTNVAPEPVVSTFISTYTTTTTVTELPTAAPVPTPSSDPLAPEATVPAPAPPRAVPEQAPPFDLSLSLDDIADWFPDAQPPAAKESGIGFKLPQFSFLYSPKDVFEIAYQALRRWIPFL